MFKKVTPGSQSRLSVVDHRETYGRHVLRKALDGLSVSSCVDLGCGEGEDLRIVKDRYPAAHCVGIDHGLWNRDKLAAFGIDVRSVNIEADRLPLPDESVDLVVANQILEHTKEIYWIHHEIFRTLAVGGHLYLGVPNVLSLHNRLLGLIGVHPTSCKMISAHVRVFSKPDTLLFYREVAGTLVDVRAVYAAQFYPFPGPLARVLATALPTLAYSIFFLIRKNRPYRDEFLEHLNRVPLETNFYRGDHVTGASAGKA